MHKISKMFKLTLLILFCLCSWSLAARVELFEHGYFDGRSFELDLVGKNCTSFDKKDWCYDREEDDVKVRECDSFEGLASSINTHGGCVAIFDEPDCQGVSAMIRPGDGNHEDLQDINWNDRVVSIRQC